MSFFSKEKLNLMDIKSIDRMKEEIRNSEVIW